MAKKIKAIIKLALPAGKATPAPPVGPALGQHGINIHAFCKDYNAKTMDKVGFIIPVKITAFEDKSFTFILKTPPVSSLLLKNLDLKKGSSVPNKNFIAKISKEKIKEIAEIKLPDLNTQDLEKAINIVIGTAKSMGIQIIDIV